MGAFKSLDSYIYEKNLWNRMAGKEDMRLHSLSDDQVEYLYSAMEADLSPENLHCDGEISQKQAQRKLNYLTDCWIELEMVSGTRRDMP